MTTVAILGSGTIGASWTSLFLAAGHDCQVYDAAQTAPEYVQNYVEAAWPSLEALGLAITGRQGRLSFCQTPGEAVSGADIVQESVPERLEIKHALFQEIEPYLTHDAIVASSASGLMVKEMQQGFNNPGRLILAHPFNPPHLIPLVELLVNGQTDGDVLEKAEAFYQGCGKVTIRLNKEVPGHVANRLQAALWREAVHLVVEGVASLEDVDTAISAGPGLRWAAMGPHMLFNLGSGGHGMGVFCERYGPSFHRWWEDMGQPTLTPEVITQLVEGIASAEKGRSFAELAKLRDDRIIAATVAMQQIGDN